MALGDQLLLRQIFLQRYSRGEAKRLVKYLNSIKHLVLAQVENGYTPEAAVILAKKIEKIVGGVVTEYGDDLLKGVEQLTASEAKFIKKMMDKATSKPFILPTDKQILAQVTNTKMVLEVGKKAQRLTINKAVSVFTKNKSKEIGQIIRDGGALGRTTAEVAGDITNIIDHRTKKQAEALVRTITNHTGATARAATYKENDDVVIGEIYTATLDSSTTVGCASLDGHVFPVGEGVMVPRHWNCLTPSTSVTPRGVVSYITKRPFNGQVVTIRTARNNSITVTLNHPVMTEGGFFAAEVIKKGDNLVSGLGGQAAITASDDNKMVSSIKKGFDSFAASREMLACPMPLAAEDFHGDITENEVGVVLINVELLDAFVSSVSHQYVERFLEVGGFDCLVDKSGFGHFSDFVGGFFSSTHCGVSFSGEKFDLLRGRIVHSGLLLLRSISCGDTVIGQTSNDDTRGCSQPLSDTGATDAFVKQVKNDFKVKGHEFKGRVNASTFKGAIDSGLADPSYSADFSRLQPLIIETDTVVDVSFSDFSGHVYNLECGDGAYSANNIITHNCRSIRVPKVNSKYDLGAGIEGKRASETGLQSGKTTYGQWLKKQNKAAQIEVLGEERASLFRSGKLKIGDFTDDKGREYTLKQLENLNPSIFE